MSFNYKELHHLQVGRIGEYWIKLMLTMHGCDTYYSDVDNKAIDFVVRLDNAEHIDIQVKTVRNRNYIFVSKSSWSIDYLKRDNLYLAVVLLEDNSYPKAYLIPASGWLSPNALLCDRTYTNRINQDEWGINLSKKNMPLLEKYAITNQISNLKKSTHEKSLARRSDWPART